MQQTQAPCAPITWEKPLPHSPVLVCLPARPWLYSLGVKSLRDIPNTELERLKCLGPDIIWLQGVWTLGKYGRCHDIAEPGRLAHFYEVLGEGFTEEDCIGSPYAVSDYSCNVEEVGSNEDLIEFRARLQSHCQARLLLDFVPNHTATDSPWINECPEIYLQHGCQKQPMYGRDPYSGDWTDTAQLNYWSDSCRKHMQSQLRRVAGLCDGVRVDMAMLCCNDVVARTWGEELKRQGFTRPTTEFWPDTIDLVHKDFPDFFLLAECYEYEQIFPKGTAAVLLAQGFNCTYDKVLYDRLRNPSPRTAHLDNLRSHILSIPREEQHRQVRFVENHDEERSLTAFAPGAEVAWAAAVITLTLPGVRLLFWGQEAGCSNRLAVHLRRAASEAGQADTATFYTQLLCALKSDAFRTGVFHPLTCSGSDGWRLVAWIWSDCMGSASWLVVVNYSESEAWGTVQGLGNWLSNAAVVRLTDVLAQDTVYERSASELVESGLTVGLRPFGAHLFAVNCATSC